MGARRMARERALQALYQLEASPQATVNEALEAAWSASEEEGPKEQTAHQFALELLDGVHSHKNDIDELIQMYSHNWRLDRMSRIDRNVLRLGVFELKYREDIPRKVSINEAIELGKKFGNDESAKFINGLLDRIAESLQKS